MACEPEMMNAASPTTAQKEAFYTKWWGKLVTFWPAAFFFKAMVERIPTPCTRDEWGVAMGSSFPLPSDDV
jgi:hypothetical protein